RAAGHRRPPAVRRRRPDPLRRAGAGGPRGGPAERRTGIPRRRVHPFQRIRLVPVSKRRVIPNRPGPGEAPQRMPPAVALSIALVVVAVVIAGGTGIDLAAGPHPAATFARCQTATRLAPNVYSAAPPMCIDPKATYRGTMKTTKGDITFVLLAKTAPRTTN